LGDVDGDGDLDAFVTKHHPSEVWLNDGSGTFSDSGLAMENPWGTGVSLGDVDGDGDLDAFVVNDASEPNRVWINEASFDLGDAPAPYPTILAQGGARHGAAGPTLGVNRTTEVEWPELAYQMDEQFGFCPATSDDYNYHGMGAKYFRGDPDGDGASDRDPWYFILPNGEVYAWIGSFLVPTLDLGHHILVGTLDPSYYADLSRLYDAYDEDGVTFGSPIMVGQLDATATVNVQNAPSGAKLDAWIDFDGDGSWDGQSEQVADSEYIVEGDNVIAFDVPSWAISGTTYARFRLSTAGNLGVDGAAADGEVEDYQITIRTSGLRVTSAEATNSGVLVRFSRPIDRGTLNLYDVDPSVFGPADVTLVGDVVGPISGSLIVDGRQIEFVATGGPLPPDRYTLTLRSAEDGFKSQDSAGLLDGEYGGRFPSGDGTAGGDFVFAFTVNETGPIVVSLPDFARGPSQTVNVPAAEVGGAGIPIQLDDGAGVESVDMTFTYDPDLLAVTDVVLGPDAPADSHLVTNLTDPGRVILSYFSLDPMPAGEATFVTVVADVPETAPYRAAHVLDITDVNVNEGGIAATGDDGLHVVTYLGDATGNRYYSGLDGQKVARVAAERDTGFEAYRMVDPLIVGDIDVDGTLDSSDRDCIMQEAVDLDCLHIPPLPRHQSLESRVAAAHGQISVPGEVQEFTLDVTQGPVDGIYSIQVWDHHETGIDPDAVQILDENGAPVAVREVVADAAADGPSRSAVVVQLAPGQYSVRVSSQNSAVGDYRIDVSVPGASNDEGIVHARDLQTAEVAMLQHHFGFNASTQELFGSKLGIDLSTDQFRPAFDANLDGQIDPTDMDAIITNFGSGAPVQVRAALTPVPNGGSSAAVPESPPVIASSGDEEVSPFQNPDRPSDVNADNQVTPMDVLLVINTINREGSRPAGDMLSGSGMADGEAEYIFSPPFYDVSGDYIVSPLDVLLVINDLNADGAMTAGAAGEGESSAVEELVSEPVLITPVVWSNLGSGASTSPALPTITRDDASSGKGGGDLESPALDRSAGDNTTSVHSKVFGDEDVLADSLEPDADVLEVLANDLVEIWMA